MAVTAKSLLKSRKYLDMAIIAPPSWQEIAEELRSMFGKSELSKTDIAKYLGCEHKSPRLQKLLAGVSYVGVNTGKRYHVQSVAKAYVKEFCR